MYASFDCARCSLCVFVVGVAVVVPRYCVFYLFTLALCAANARTFVAARRGAYEFLMIYDNICVRCLCARALVLRELFALVIYIFGRTHTHTRAAHDA